VLLPFTGLHSAIYSARSSIRVCSTGKASEANNGSGNDAVEEDEDEEDEDEGLSQLLYDREAVILYRCKWMCDDACDLKDMARIMREQADYVEKLAAEGYELDVLGEDYFEFRHEGKIEEATEAFYESKKGKGKGSSKQCE
jgi:hypothetical protein